jgi:hypothetical protein
MHYERAPRFRRSRPDGCAVSASIDTACSKRSRAGVSPAGAPTVFGADIAGHQNDAYNSTVRRPLANVFLLMGILTSTCLAFSEHSSKIETMAGRIVAYSNGLMCLNGNAYWSMLIHIQDHATDVPSQFVEVQFSLPCNKSPEWLTRKSSIQKFRLTRNEDADSVLREFIDCDAGSPSGHTPEPCSHVPMWKHVPSAEHEKLPFGQRVPSYLSVDLPLAPVI